MPDSLLNALRKRAELHRRRLNSEVLHLLEISALPQTADSEVSLARIHRLQGSAPLPLLTDKVLNEAMKEGRL